METVKASHGFRKKIREHLPLWQKEGFIGAEQAERLAAYYRLDGLKGEMNHLMLMGVYLIGVILIGIGIISFVAAHWTVLGRGVKVALLLAAMLAAHGTGYYLWQGSGRSPKLGHALVVLGTLIFGANIGLMAQIFHVYENPANGYMAWAIGALAVAYALLSVPTALVAIVTAMIYFFMGLDKGAGSNLLWFPLVFAVVFIPLAYLCRSRWVLTAILIALGLSIEFIFVDIDRDIAGPFLAPLITAVVFTAWGVLNSRSERTSSFAMPCQIIGFAMGFGVLYLLSFWDITADFGEEYRDLFGSDWAIWVITGVVGGFALLLSLWAIIGRGGFNGKSNLILLAASAIITLVLASIDAYLLVVAVHILALLLSANLIRISVQTQSRGLFWAGIWLPGLIILSRTLEYETELLIKAVIFAACGIGVIFAGVMFERQLRRKGVSHV